MEYDNLAARMTPDYKGFCRMTSYLDHLECTQCGKDYPYGELIKVSPCCGKVLFARYDLPRLDRKSVV